MLCCPCSQVFSIPRFVHKIPHHGARTRYMHQPSMKVLKISKASCPLCELVWHFLIQEFDGCEPQPDDPAWQAPISYEFEETSGPTHMSMRVFSGLKRFRLETLRSACKLGLECFLQKCL